MGGKDGRGKQERKQQEGGRGSQAAAARLIRITQASGSPTQQQYHCNQSFNEGSLSYQTCGEQHDCYKLPSLPHPFSGLLKPDIK